MVNGRAVKCNLEALVLASAFNLSINNISNNNGNFHHTHLVLYNCVYLNGCSQFKQVETRSKQLDLVAVHMI